MSTLTTAEIALPDLDGEDAWVAHVNKVPHSPHTGRKATGKHSTWGGTYKAASTLAKRLGGGIGIVLGTPFRDYRLLGIDLDGCRNPRLDTLTPWARKIIKGLPATYWEVSPSGTGVKGFMLCTESDWQRVLDRMGKMGRNFKVKAAKGDKAPGIEAYIGERYFTVTDDLLPGSPETLAVVNAEDFLWVVETAGPRFLADHTGTVDAGQTGGWSDESESGIGWRIAVEAARDGADFEDYLDRLKACDDVSRWRDDDRQVERTWANALAKAEAESTSIAFEDLTLKPDEPTEVDALNRTLAVVKIGGKTVIAHFKSNGQIDFGNATDLHTLYANDRVAIRKGKVVPVSEAWLQSPKRRTYRNGVTFDPSGKTGGRTLNLWTGWAVEPNPYASCKLFLDHIRNVTCCGHEESIRYLLGWMAHLVQHPEVKPGVAPIFKGGKGAGKSIVSDYLAAMIGTRHSPVIADSNQLAGRFNAHMENTLLLRVEEGFWAGDRKAEGVLKNLVTSETLAIERKGIDVIMLPSVLRIIITSNSDWIVPASFDERRWAVFNVSGSRIGDRKYFDALGAEMAGDGTAALLHYLQHYDLTGFDVRTPPKTEGLLEQKLASLRDFDKWWFNALHRGDLADDWENGTVRVSCDSIADDYNAHAKDDRFHAQHMDGRSIGKALKRVCPAVERKYGGTRSSRIWQYRIPMLAECRREFEKLAGRKIDWSGDNA